MAKLLCLLFVHSLLYSCGRTTKNNNDAATLAPTTIDSISFQNSHSLAIDSDRNKIYHVADGKVYSTNIEGREAKQLELPPNVRFSSVTVNPQTGKLYLVQNNWTLLEVNPSTLQSLELNSTGEIREISYLSKNNSDLVLIRNPWNASGPVSVSVLNVNTHEDRRILFTSTAPLNAQLVYLYKIIEINNKNYALAQVKINNSPNEYCLVELNFSNGTIAAVLARFNDSMTNFSEMLGLSASQDGNLIYLTLATDDLTVVKEYNRNTQSMREILNSSNAKFAALSTNISGTHFIPNSSKLLMVDFDNKEVFEFNVQNLSFRPYFKYRQ